MLVAFAYSDDDRFDGVPWLPRPGHAPSSSAVPNGDEKRTTTASSCIAFTAKFGSEAYTDDARDERADDRSGVRLMHSCRVACRKARNPAKREQNGDANGESQEEEREDIERTHALGLKHTQTTRAMSARTIGAAEGRPRIPRREKARGLRDRDELPLGRFRDAEMVRPVRHSGTNPLHTHRLWRDPCRTRLVIAGVRAAPSRALSACRRQMGPAPLAPAQSKIPCH